MAKDAAGKVIDTKREIKQQGTDLGKAIITWQRCSWKSYRFNRERVINTAGNMA